MIKWFRLGIVYGWSLFNDFSDPQNRGRNFKWRNFPRMVFRMTWRQFFISYKTKVYKVTRPLGCLVAMCIAYNLAYVDIRNEKLMAKLDRMS